MRHEAGGEVHPIRIAFSWDFPPHVSCLLSPVSRLPPPASRLLHTMVFENPSTLFLLWLVFPILFFLWYSRSRAKQFLPRFIGPAMQAALVPQGSFVRWLIRSSLIVITFVCMVLAVARPQFGVYFEDTKRFGADIFVVLDVSRSMLAEDVPPNRLSRAKSEICDLLDRVVGDRVGLIVFAGKPRTLLPLTVDVSFFLEILNKVDTESSPRGGTAIGDAIRLAVRTLPKGANRDGAILLITDGEDHESFPLDAAKEAAASGVKIFTVVLGDSQEGARIPIIDEYGNRTYQKYEGREIWSRVDAETLKQIAEITGGVFVPAQTAVFDLGQFYSDYMAGLKHGEYQIERRKQRRERFQLFLFLAIGTMTAYLMIPEYRSSESHV